MAELTTQLRGSVYHYMVLVLLYGADIGLSAKPIWTTR
jgi:hypothetical protein